MKAFVFDLDGFEYRPTKDDRPKSAGLRLIQVAAEGSSSPSLGEHRFDGRLRMQAWRIPQHSDVPRLAEASA
jgi:hypothetical protein